MCGGGAGGAAEWRDSSEGAVVEHPWAAFTFDGLLIFFGAMGEELMFRGYAFQLLIRCVGPLRPSFPPA